MNERAEGLRNMIASKEKLINEGVGEERKAELQTEVTILQQELDGLQELPETPAEPILAEIDGLPLEVFTKNEDAAILIRCEVESLIEARGKNHKEAIAELKNRLGLSIHAVEALTRERDELNVELKRFIDALNETTVKHNDLFGRYEEKESLFNQIILERDQSLLYRDNAIKQLEDMAFELEQNRIELNRNREVRALTEAERTAEQEAARQRFMDSRVKIYNPRNADELNSRERIANIVETGEEIRYLAIYEKGGYNIITEYEALGIQAMNKPIEMPEVDEAEVFQGEDAGLPDVQQGTEQGNSGSQQQAIRENETFEQEVRRRLTALEESVADIIG